MSKNLKYAFVGVLISLGSWVIFFTLYDTLSEIFTFITKEYLRDLAVLGLIFLIVMVILGFKKKTLSKFIGGVLK